MKVMNTHQFGIILLSDVLLVHIVSSARINFALRRRFCSLRPMSTDLIPFVPFCSLQIILAKRLIHGCEVQVSWWAVLASQGSQFSHHPNTQRFGAYRQTFASFRYSENVGPIQGGCNCHTAHPRVIWDTHKCEEFIRMAPRIMPRTIKHTCFVNSQKKIRQWTL